MKMSRFECKRGQMRVIETILAASLIIVALSSFSFFNLTPLTHKYEVTDLEKMGYSVLHDLDQHGLLARFVYCQQWTEIRAALKITLPVNVYFNVIIYDRGWNRLDDGLITYGETQTFTNARNLVSISYVLVGYPLKNAAGNYEAKYDPRVVVLQLVQGD